MSSLVLVIHYTHGMALNRFPKTTISFATGVIVYYFLQTKSGIHKRQHYQKPNCFSCLQKEDVKQKKRNVKQKT